MRVLNQLAWWLHATWFMPITAGILGVTAYYLMGFDWVWVQTVVLGAFSVICVIWWFWIMGAVRHIIETYDRVEHQLIRVSDQLTDIKREMGSIREHNY